MLLCAVLIEIVRMSTPPNHLKLWRQFCNLTLTEAADRISCTASALSKLENGRLRVTDRWLHRLATAYGRSPAALLSPPGQHADIQIVPGETSAEDSAAMAKLWQAVPARFRPHLLAVMEGAATGDTEQRAFLDADIHAHEVAATLDIGLNAVQRAHLIERSLKQQAEQQATRDRPGVVVEQGLPENY